MWEAALMRGIVVEQGKHSKCGVARGVVGAGVGIGRIGR
jgi:hypothetical protein